MSRETRRQLADSSRTLIKGTLEYGTAGAQYCGAAAIGGSAGLLIGAAAGLAGGALVSAAIAGLDFGVIALSSATALGTAGLGVGATIGLKLVEPSASERTQKGNALYKKGFRELRALARETRPYQRIANMDRSSSSFFRSSESSRSLNRDESLESFRPRKSL